MVGITAYGVYIPYSRIERKRIAEAHGEKGGKGEKAVASHDEDSVSMAVEATLDAIAHIDTAAIDRLFFATTTAPYREKLSSAMIAHALDFKQTIRAVDITDSLRASSMAMLSAIDAIRAGAKASLVVSADCRIGQAQGTFENVLGDGAASIVFGAEHPLATVEAVYSVMRDISDQWRASNDIYVRSWEERFGIQSGYEPLVKEAVKGLLREANLNPSEITKVVLAGPQERYQKSLGISLRFAEEQLHLGHEAMIGNCGTAQAPLMLVDVLEQSQPGDTILFVTYGSGSDAILLKVTEAIRAFLPRKGFARQLKSKRNNISYETYLKWKNMLPFEPPRRPEIPRPSAPAMFRNQKQTLGGYGSQCLACGTPQYPVQRVCIACGAVDQMQPYKFTDKEARIVTYTSDYLTVSPDPPTTFVVVDFQDGGRMITELVDYQLDALSVGMDLEMTFRHLYEAGSLHNYTWKVRPKR